MRGQPLVFNPIADTLRIIPARAGPTTSSRLKACQKPDHPRSCGANLLCRTCLNNCPGSSPLVRGQHDFLNGRTIVQRIIPARAGPTSVLTIWSACRADHPRSCGANVTLPPHHHATSGSSPLVRGQRHLLASERRSGRIIPARAGPTERSAAIAFDVADHPRSCGANFLSLSARSGPAGSSPLVRGQLDCQYP